MTNETTKYQDVAAVYEKFRDLEKTMREFYEKHNNGENCRALSEAFQALGGLKSALCYI